MPFIAIVESDETRSQSNTIETHQGDKFILCVEDCKPFFVYAKKYKEGDILPENIKFFTHYYEAEELIRKRDYYAKENIKIKPNKNYQIFEIEPTFTIKSPFTIVFTGYKLKNQ